ncbi:MAG: glycosyltransferase family 39 protein [Acidobacteriota bacterium]
MDCGKQKTAVSGQEGLLVDRAVILIVYLIMLALSWRRWLSPIADSGRELDLPRRILAGEMLYRDIHYLYPPFAPYFKALLYRLFGVDLAVLQWSGVVATLLILCLVHAVARRMLGRLESVLAAVAVVVFCIFRPTGSMISPYSYAALYGLVFSLTALLAVVWFIETGRVACLVLAGVLTGLALITKQEFALAALGAAVAALSAQWRRGDLLVETLLFLLPLVAIVVPVYAWFFHQVGWTTMVEDCHIFFTNLPAPMVLYNARRTGLDHPFLSFLQMLGAGMVLVVIGTTLITTANPRLWRRGPTWLILGSAIGAIILIRVIVGPQWDGSPLRFMPILLLIVIIKVWRRDPVILTLAVYSLALLARVALRVPSGGAFGSFFLPGSLVILIWLLAKKLPDWAAQNGLIGRPAPLRRVVLGLLVATLLGTSVVSIHRYRRIYNFWIETARGRFYAPATTGPALRAALDFIERRTSQSAPVVVLPEGSEIPFLTDRHSPLRHQILIPGLMSRADEALSIETLDRLEIPYILIVNRPMREFGSTAFGEDFYQDLGRAIADRYRLAEVYGADGDRTAQIGDPRFFIRIYERKVRLNAP